MVRDDDDGGWMKAWEVTLWLTYSPVTFQAHTPTKPAIIHPTHHYRLSSY